MPMLQAWLTWPVPLPRASNEVLATMTTDDYNTMMDEAISVQPLSE